MVLKPVNILVDVVHNVPPDSEVLLSRCLRDILDRPAPPIAIAHTHPENTVEESDGSRAPKYLGMRCTGGRRFNRDIGLIAEASVIGPPSPRTSFEFKGLMLLIRSFQLQ